MQKKVDEIERRISVTSLQQEHEMLEQSVLQQEVEKFQRQQQQHLIREERSPGTANMNNIVRTSLNNNNNNTTILQYFVTMIPQMIYLKILIQKM